jgi:heme/copper-type cytochrome/quinol oxidase subunit 1
MMIGLNLTFFPMHFIGLLGMPRRIYRFDTTLGLDAMNLAATIGAFILGAGFLVFLYNAWTAARRERTAPANPWDAATLEWAMSSPPPVYNFSVLPEVRSRLPLWTDRGVSEIPEVPPAPVHVPGGSHWPIVTAFGILVVSTGAISQVLPIVFVGTAILVFGVYRWAFEPFEV